ncbi:MAG: GNAT family N-acetyltransferase [bacterium]
MSIAVVSYKIKTVSEEEICSHLYCCNNNFSPPLIQRVNIDKYSKKIFDKAITFEAWHDKKLIGLVAAYFNDSSGCTGYITNVSVNLDFMGKGIATTLMNNCLKYAKQCDIKNITMEVLINNYSAMCLYKKFGFKKIENQGNMVLMQLNFSEQGKGEYQ